MTGTCYWCGPTDEELRPYGPGGATICHPCMKQDPKREEAAMAAFGALLDAVGTLSPVVVIGEPDGPRPLAEGDLL